MWDPWKEFSWKDGEGQSACSYALSILAHWRSPRVGAAHGPFVLLNLRAAEHHRYDHWHHLQSASMGTTATKFKPTVKGPCSDGELPSPARFTEARTEGPLCAAWKLYRQTGVKMTARAYNYMRECQAHQRVVDGDHYTYSGPSHADFILSSQLLLRGL